MKLDLQKKKVLITRAEHQSEDFRKLIERANGTPVLFPTIEIKPIADQTLIKQTFDNLESIDWIVFTSENAVKYFFHYAEQYAIKFYFYPNLKIATVGEKTKLILEQLGFRTNFVPIQYTAQVLAENMDAEIEGKRILIPRSSKASQEYLEVFEKRGAIPMPLTIYENSLKENDIQQTKAAIAEVDYVTFTSGSTVKGFQSALTKANIERPKAKYISIGPSTTKVAHLLGIQIDLTAETYTIEGILDAIKTLEHE